MCEAFLWAKLKKLMWRNQRFGTKRTEAEQEILGDALKLMVQFQKQARVTDRDLIVMGYLARNPGALIVPDNNVAEAFEAAKRAIELQEWGFVKNEAIK